MLRLRRDVDFGDGTPLTSADVVFSLRRLVNLKGNPSFLLARYPRVGGRLKYAVVLTSSIPQPQLLAVLATPSTAVVDSKLVRAHGGTDADDASTADKAEQWLNSPASAGAGSGPYELASYEPTSQITLRPNANYWGTRKPGFGSVVIRNMPAPTQLLNIRRGTHQIAVDLSSDQAETLDGAARTARYPPALAVRLLRLHEQRPAGVEGHLEPAVPAGGSLGGRLQGACLHRRAGGNPGTRADPIDDPRRPAAEGRTEAGTRGGQGRPRSVRRRRGEGDPRVPERRDGQRRAVQPRSHRQSSPSSRALDSTSRLQGPRLRRSSRGSVPGRWPSASGSGARDYPDPADYLVFTPGNLIALHAGWPAGSDPALETLAARARVATVPPARSALYRQIQLGLNARSPFIPLIQPTQVFVATSDLAGAAFSGAYDVDLTQVTPKYRPGPRRRGSPSELSWRGHHLTRASVNLRAG